MATLPLNCGSNDLVIDASASSVTINSLGAITLAGPMKFSSMGTGMASFDASGNVSSVAGVPFNTASAYTLTNTWTHSNPVQINSTLGVTGTTTLAGAVLNTGITTQASVLGVTIQAPPSGHSFVIINNTTGQLYRMT